MAASLIFSFHPLLNPKTNPPSKTPPNGFRSFTRTNSSPRKSRTWARKGHFKKLGSLSFDSPSTVESVATEDYEFSDSFAEAELRLPLQGRDIQSSHVFIDVKENSLTIKVHSSGSLVTLMETDLYDKIKPSETIWYIDEDQLVINLKKHDSDLKWPDVKETWASLTTGVLQLLRGTSVYTIGESTEVNEIVAKELAVGLGYTPLNTSELLERYVKQSIDSWMIAEGADSVAEAEATILESLSSHVRAAVGTLGEPFGAAGRADKWRHLHSGFAIWLSQCDTADEASAKEEARRHIQDGNLAYSNADVVVKLGGWDPDHARTVAQTCLSALKQLILSDKTLTGKKSLYIRLGCRGDWPNIKPPGWDPSTGADVTIV
ncbi:hypothetical protein QJS10_CPA10g01207 [Acorus calamus]|uniref:CS domain-containing protein n=1 Tax=Acorus calamus TaxID=4465 RepID=A0AAV9E0G2_ACOCL|nr:hypothetical protein QJS10_CPA10g01207 [Acorus calamus]